MKRITLTLGIFLGVGFAFSQSTWTTQSSNTTETLRDVHFKDLSNGMAVGSGGIMLGTMDGGTIWTQAICPTLIEFL